MKKIQLPNGNIRMLRTFAIFFTMCGLLFLSGCRSPLEPTDTPGNGSVEADAGMGTLALAIKSQYFGRTILPEISLDDFIRFDLEFVPCDQCLSDNVALEIISWGHDCIAEGFGTIELPVGIWDVRLAAFICGGEEAPAIEMARGSLAGIEIHSRETVSGNIVLSPIAGGTGTFSWDICFGEENIVTASMEITLIGNNADMYWGTFSFIGDVGVPTANPGSLDLPTGQYRVIFTLYNAEGIRVVVSAILHIYRNMESHFAEEFMYDHFRVSLLDIVLDAWDGSRWDFEESGIRAGHFSALGIDGVYGSNFAAIASWFDTLSFPNMIPNELYGLKILVDAALVGIASLDIGFLNVVRGNWNEIQNAVAGLVKNGTAVAFGGWIGDNTVLVNVGAYQVEFVFGSLPTVPGATLAAQLAWLRTNAQSGNRYFVEINVDQQNIAPEQAALPTGISNLTIVMRGRGTAMRTVNLSADGVLFTVNQGITLALYNNVTLQGRSTNSNHLVRLNSGGTLIMNEGARIANNVNTTTTSADGGGGVRVNNGGVFILDGGEISGNSATASTAVGNGGGAFVASGGRFDMLYGTIYGNTGWIGGGVHVANGGNFRISGGVIYGNETTVPQERRNISSGTSGASLNNAGVATAAQRGTFNNEGVFTSLSNLPTINRTMRLEGGELLLNRDEYGNRIVPGITLVEQLDWLRFLAGNGNSYLVERSGTESISPTNTALPTGRSNVSITLRGSEPSTISLSANGVLFDIPSGIILVLDENITLQGRDGNNASLIQVNSGGNLIMNEKARITGNINNTNMSGVASGGVRVNTGGTFTMYGGEISRNAATTMNGSGGVRVDSGGMFTMHGGEISNNIAPGTNVNIGNNSAGGVHAGGTFTMYGGEIYGNNTTGNNSGGGVLVGGTFNMYGGEIFGNTAGSSVQSNSGGGVRVGGGGTFRISDGVIYGSNATMRANIGRGGIAALFNVGTTLVGTGDFATADILYTTNFTIHVVDGVLQLPQGDSLAAQLNRLHFTAQSGGEYIIELHGNEDIAPTQTMLPSGRINLSITLMGSVQSEIRLFTSGVLFSIPSGTTLVLDDNVTLVGLNVDRVNRNNYRALVEINEGGTLVMNHGSKITGNTNNSNRSSGGVHVGFGGTFVMHGGKISSNAATLDGVGGGVSVSGGGIFVMHDGKISSNVVNDRGSGGGVRIVGDGTFTMYGGEISGNTTTTMDNRSGGGVIIDRGTFVMHSGKISDNIVV